MNINPTTGVSQESPVRAKQHRNLVNGDFGRGSSLTSYLHQQQNSRKTILGSPMKNPNSKSILKLQDHADEQAVPMSVVGKRHDAKIMN